MISAIDPEKKRANHCRGGKCTKSIRARRCPHRRMIRCWLRSLGQHREFTIRTTRDTGCGMRGCEDGNLVFFLEGREGELRLPSRVNAAMGCERWNVEREMENMRDRWTRERGGSRYFSDWKVAGYYLFLLRLRQDTITDTRIKTSCRSLQLHA